MVDVRRVDELADAAAGQWGMFTAEQAHRLGLTSDQMAELVAAHRISRTETPGVYRFAGVPVDVTLDALRATWLSLDPAALAGERLDALRSGGPGAIVSHVSAAHYVYELGTLHPRALDYTVPAAPEASSPRGLSSMPLSVGRRLGNWSAGCRSRRYRRPSPTCTATGSTAVTWETSSATFSLAPWLTCALSPQSLIRGRAGKLVATS